MADAIKSFSVFNSFSLYKKRLCSSIVFVIREILKRVIKMCTAFRTNSYFGRNLDLDFSFGESVIITPKKFPFCFRKVFPQNEHFAIIGIGTISDGYPLYYDAMNEMGLCMAGLNFPDNAYFPPVQKNERCIGPKNF